MTAACVLGSFSNSSCAASRPCKPPSCASAAMVLLWAKTATSTATAGKRPTIASATVWESSILFSKEKPAPCCPWSARGQVWRAKNGGTIFVVLGTYSILQSESLYRNRRYSSNAPRSTVTDHLGVWSTAAMSRVATSRNARFALARKRASPGWRRLDSRRQWDRWLWAGIRPPPQPLFSTQAARALLSGAGGWPKQAGGLALWHAATLI